MDNKYHNNMTEEDYEYVRQNYQQQEIKDIAEHLHKAPQTIHRAMRKMKLYKNPQWTEDDICFLKENYGKLSNKAIGLKLDRTAKAVSGKAHGLGLVKNPSCTNWTEEELDILKQNVSKLDYEELHKLLPNRTITAIYNKVYELQLNSEEFRGYKKLKSEHILFILENCHRMTDKELAYRFNVSESAIVAVRKKHKIHKTPSLGMTSSVEKIVEEWLTNMQIPFLMHEKLDRFIPDFQIKGTKIIIEVQGDYYHCNPYLYPNGPKNDQQLRYVVNDYYKKCFYLGNGYTLIELWEHDILHNFDNVQKILKEKLTAVCG